MGKGCAEARLRELGCLGSRRSNGDQARVCERREGCAEARPRELLDARLVEIEDAVEAVGVALEWLAGIINNDRGDPALEELNDRQ